MSSGQSADDGLFFSLANRCTSWSVRRGKFTVAYSQIGDPSLAYTDLVALGSRLKPPKGWQYRSRTLTADLIAQSGGEAHIIQDELQNTYQRLPSH
jgi:hypothetical protein